MQPIEHMQPSEEELAAHIKESLIWHEEEYVPGAWENFNKKKAERSGIIFWMGRLSGVAAVFLIGVGLFLYVSKDAVKVGIKTTKIKSLKKEAAPVRTIREKSGTDPIERFQRREVVATANKNNVSEGIPNKELIRTNHSSSDSNEIIIAKTITKVVKTQEADKKPEEHHTGKEDKKMSFQDFLAIETGLNKEGKTDQESVKKENKWEMGLVVAPSFGGTKNLNMGYGVSMDYAISDKISLNSGISYNEMAASKSINVPSIVSTAIAGSGKNLESVEAKLVGIDIPLEVKYHVSKNIYANVGVSAFAILSQKQSNNYIEERVVEQPASTANTPSGFRAFVVNERTSEAVQPESEIKDGKYLGFYNFSVGYKQKISKNMAVSVEPFMKVPMKEVTKENLRLLGTGVKLKLDF